MTKMEQRSPSRSTLHLRGGLGLRLVGVVQICGAQPQCEDTSVSGWGVLRRRQSWQGGGGWF